MEFKILDKQIAGVKLFYLAAQLGSLTSAAIAAGVTPQIVSREVARLEERFRVRFYIGTANHIRLTAPGRRFFEQCKRSLMQLHYAEKQDSKQEEDS